MVRISLCVIAKDEERFLPGCLASVRGAVDDIIVVDTGSTDRSRELAVQGGARLFEVPWEEDFAASRNYAIRCVTGGWILQLDADERLAPGAGPALRSALCGACFDVGMLPLHDALRVDASAEEVLSGHARLGPPMRHPRLLRNAGGLEYHGIIHESVADWAARRGSRIAPVEASIIHYGNVPAARHHKEKRNLALLRRRCEANASDAVAFGYLASELLRSGDVEGAWRASEAGWASFAVQPAHLSLHRLGAMRALAELGRGDVDAALETVERVESRQGPHPELHYLRGRAFELRAEIAGSGTALRRDLSMQAARYYQAAVHLRDPPPSESIILEVYEPSLLARLGDALLVADRAEPALQAYCSALQGSEQDLRGQLGRAEATLDLGDPARVLGLINVLLNAENNPRGHCGQRSSVSPEAPACADAWILAAAAASALGAKEDAKLFATRAREELPRGLVAPHRHGRLEILLAVLAAGAEHNLEK